MEEIKVTTDKIKLLQQVLDNVNSWLHFAEAKNAALAAFNIALLAAILTSPLIDLSLFLFCFLVIILLCSTFITLCSFKPINNKLKKCDNANITKNLLHFAYIASLDRDEYILKLYEYYWNEGGKDINTVSQLEKDYGEEIIENSRIVLHKQNFFKISLYIVLLTFFITILLVIDA